MKTAQWDKNCERRRWGHLLSRVCLNSALQRKHPSLNTEKPQRLLQRNWPCCENMACPGEKKRFYKSRISVMNQCVCGGGGVNGCGRGNPPKVKPKLGAKFPQCCGLCAVNKGRTEFSRNCATQPGPFWTLLAPCHQNQVLLNGNAERCIKSWRNTDQDCDNRVTSQAGTDGELREKLARARCLIGWLAQRKGRGLCALVRNPGSSRSF